MLLEEIKPVEAFNNKYTRKISFKQYKSSIIEYVPELLLPKKKPKIILEFSQNILSVKKCFKKQNSMRLLRNVV
jgi:hypothetical protein